MSDRRSFLRGLTTLPLIGGAVTLIGQPTAAAVPITRELLDGYATWLDLERLWLRWERYGADCHQSPVLAPVEVVFRHRQTGHVFNTHHLDNAIGTFDHTRRGKLGRRGAGDRWVSADRIGIGLSLTSTVCCYSGRLAFGSRLR